MRPGFLYILFLSCISIMASAKTGKEIIQLNNFKSEVTPMLTTEWAQDGGENSMLPIVDGHHAKTGCGATATAQVMKYWNYPQRGSGRNYYIWDNPQSERIVLYADFGESAFDWSNMIDRYKNNSSATQTEIDAVSELMADIGIALEMKYQSSSTATNIEYISTALKKYFGYNPTMTIHRFANGAYSMNEWLTLIYKELSEGRPVIMGGAYHGANHIFVADGYDADGKVHLNLGKASIGSSCNIDGFYDLTITGQTYNEDMRMLIGISPVELPAEPHIFNITDAGTLKETMGGELESRKICRAKISGNLNAEDISWLKTLSAITTGQLSYLDLEDAHIENDVLPASSFDNSYTLQEIILPSGLTEIGARAFRNCTGLWKVKIPSTCNTIGDYAFSNCRYLEGVELSQNLKTLGTNPFRYNKFTEFAIDENTQYLIDNGALLDSGKTKLFSMPCLTVGKYTINDGIESIESQSFMKQCMIQELVIPATVSRIKSNAFLECIGIKDIYAHSQTPPVITSDSFDKNIVNTCTIHVPEGFKDTYQSSDWSIFSNIIDDIETTGIQEINQNPLNAGITYDLQGNKITSPIRGGIYIIRHPDGSTHKTILNQ